MTEQKDDREGRREPREGRREPRLRDTFRRIFREPEDLGEGGDRAPGREGPLVDARELLGAMLETGDKAKTEIVRMMAREVRAYLEALDLHNDLRSMLTNYSLEVHASIHLKPLAEVEPGPTSRVSLKKRPQEPPVEPPEDADGDADPPEQGGEE